MCYYNYYNFTNILKLEFAMIFWLNIIFGVLIACKHLFKLSELCFDMIYLIPFNYMIYVIIICFNTLKR